MLACSCVYTRMHAVTIVILWMCGVSFLFEGTVGWSHWTMQSHVPPSLHFIKQLWKEWCFNRMDELLGQMRMNWVKHLFVDAEEDQFCGTDSDPVRVIVRSCWSIDAVICMINLFVITWWNLEALTLSSTPAPCLGTLQSTRSRPPWFAPTV